MRLLEQPERYRAGIISGAPLVPVPEMLDVDSSFDLDPGWLSADPFYLDALENDPLAFVDADGAPLARELDKAWDRFGAELPTLTVPTLAVHGTDDPIAPVGAVRAYAEQIEPLQLNEFPGARHDILNETVHREVAAAIVEFVEARGEVGSIVMLKRTVIIAAVGRLLRGGACSPSRASADPGRPPVRIRDQLLLQRDPDRRRTSTTTSTSSDTAAGGSERHAPRSRCRWWIRAQRCI